VDVGVLNGAGWIGEEWRMMMVEEGVCCRQLQSGVERIAKTLYGVWCCWMFAGG
jgi:hypothetical protein